MAMAQSQSGGTPLPAGKMDLIAERGEGLPPAEDVAVIRGAEGVRLSQRNHEPAAVAIKIRGALGFVGQDLDALNRSMGAHRLDDGAQMVGGVVDPGHEYASEANPGLAVAEDPEVRRHEIGGDSAESDLLEFLRGFVVEQEKIDDGHEQIEDGPRHKAGRIEAGMDAEALGFAKHTRAEMWLKGWFSA